MSQYTKEDLNKIKKLYHEAGFLLKRNGKEYVAQRVGSGGFVKLPTLDAVFAYMLGFRDGFYEDRLFVKKRMSFGLD